MDEQCGQFIIASDDNAHIYLFLKMPSDTTLPLYEQIQRKSVYLSDKSLRGNKMSFVSLRVKQASLLKCCKKYGLYDLLL